jgi:hypothetical protein
VTDTPVPASVTAQDTLAVIPAYVAQQSLELSSYFDAKLVQSSTALLASSQSLLATTGIASPVTFFTRAARKPKGSVCTLQTEVPVQISEPAVLADPPVLVRQGMAAATALVDRSDRNFSKAEALLNSALSEKGLQAARLQGSGGPYVRGTVFETMNPTGFSGLRARLNGKLSKTRVQARPVEAQRSTDSLEATGTLLRPRHIATSASDQPLATSSSIGRVVASQNETASGKMETIRLKKQLASWSQKSLLAADFKVSKQVPSATPGQLHLRTVEPGLQPPFFDDPERSRPKSRGEKSNVNEKSKEIVADAVPVVPPSAHSVQAAAAGPPGEAGAPPTPTLSSRANLSQLSHPSVSSPRALTPHSGRSDLPDLQQGPDCAASVFSQPRLPEDSASEEAAAEAVGDSDNQSVSGEVAAEAVGDSDWSSLPFEAVVTATRLSSEEHRRKLQSSASLPSGLIFREQRAAAGDGERKVVASSSNTNLEPNSGSPPRTLSRNQPGLFEMGLKPHRSFPASFPIKSRSSMADQTTQLGTKIDNNRSAPPTTIIYHNPLSETGSLSALRPRRSEGVDASKMTAESANLEPIPTLPLTLMTLPTAAGLGMVGGVVRDLTPKPNPNAIRTEGNHHFIMQVTENRLIPVESLVDDLAMKQDRERVRTPGGSAHPRLGRATQLAPEEPRALPPPRLKGPSFALIGGCTPTLIPAPVASRRANAEPLVKEIPEPALRVTSFRGRGQARGAGKRGNSRSKIQSNSKAQSAPEIFFSDDSSAFSVQSMSTRDGARAVHRLLGGTSETEDSIAGTRRVKSPLNRGPDPRYPAMSPAQAAAATAPIKPFSTCPQGFTHPLRPESATSSSLVHQQAVSPWAESKGYFRKESRGKTTLPPSQAPSQAPLQGITSMQIVVSS